MLTVNAIDGPRLEDTQSSATVKVLSIGLAQNYAVVVRGRISTR